MTPELLEIIESLPLHPRSGDLLGAIVRAEQIGFERGLRKSGPERERLLTGIESVRRQAVSARG